MDLSKYKNPTAPIDVPIRYAQCPFCKRRKNAFVVIPRQKGYFLFCHRCHKRAWLPRDKATPSQVKKLLLPEKVSSYTIKLPLDFSKDIPNEGYVWLYNYGLSNSEIQELGVGYSPSMHRIIFPFYNDGRLIYWQGRYLDNYKKHKTPKYITRTVVNNNFWIYNPKESDTCVVVEDMLSAVKVGMSGFAGVCAFGTNISDTLIKECCSNFQFVYLWLDPDMKGKMAKVQKRAATLGQKIKVVLTQKDDPKAFSLDEIKKVIGR